MEIKLNSVKGVLYGIAMFLALRLASNLVLRIGAMGVDAVSPGNGGKLLSWF